jgi:hypothetical protein
MQDVTASSLSDDGVERLINHMRHGIDTCPFPADQCVYCERDTRCILLLQELLSLRKQATGLPEAA